MSPILFFLAWTNRHVTIWFCMCIWNLTCFFHLFWTSAVRIDKLQWCLSCPWNVHHFFGHIRWLLSSASVITCSQHNVFIQCINTNNAIFIVRQMQEEFRAKWRKLYFGFVDLEKAFDAVPREVIRWTMHKLPVEELLISAVMSVCRCKNSCKHSLW